MRLRLERVGLTREGLILLPVAFLLVLAVSFYLLISYRGSVGELAVRERTRAEKLVGELALDLGAGGGPGRLSRGGSEVLAITLVDDQGRRVDGVGETIAEPLGPFGGRIPDVPVALGPEAATGPRIIAIAPVGSGGRIAGVRLDLAAAVLATEQARLRRLVPIVLGVDLGMLALILVFLRHLLAPLEVMLAQARRSGEPQQAGQDDAAYLISTFERALANLAPEADGEQGGRGEESAVPDLTALQRTLASSLESGVLLLDASGKVLSLNPLGARLLGVPVPIPPLPLDDLLVDSPDLATRLREALELGTVIRRQEYELGASVLGFTAHPLRREDGHLRGLLVLLADLTEIRRHEAAERLGEGLRQLGEMAAGVAHELRNGVATVLGYVTLLERADDEAEQRELILELRREASHLRRVVDDFLAFARPGSARLESVDLASLVERVASDPALPWPARRGPDPAAAPAVRADPQLLERALKNLLVNAGEAEVAASGSRAEGSDRQPIEWQVEPTDGGVEVRIRDHGCGLPNEVRARLFEPFVTSKAGGVGLGLALAYRIVDLHRGRLELVSPPDGGTEARLWLPVV